MSNPLGAFSLLPPEIRAILFGYLGKNGIIPLRTCSGTLAYELTDLFYKSIVKNPHPFSGVLKIGCLNEENYFNRITFLHLNGTTEPSLLDTLSRLTSLSSLRINAPVDNPRFEKILSCATSSLVSLEINAPPLRYQSLNSGISALGKFSNLKSLNLNYCAKFKDSDVNLIATTCTKLVSLNLHYWIKITDASTTNLSNCSLLKQLILSQCDNISDSTLVSLGKCNQLTDLHLSACRKISSVGIKSLFQSLPEDQKSPLTLLSLGNTNVDDEGVKIIALKCPELNALNLNSCNISDVGLKALGENCPKLTKIFLYQSNKITDSGLLALSSCSKLQELNIACVTKITGTALQQLTLSCTELKRMNVSGTHIPSNILTELEVKGITITNDLNRNVNRF